MNKFDLYFLIMVKTETCQVIKISTKYFMNIPINRSFFEKKVCSSYKDSSFTNWNIEQGETDIPAQYRRNRQKDLRNFTIFSWNTSSANITKNPQYRLFFLKIYIKITLWASWMTSLSWLHFPNLLFSTLIWLRLVEY